MGVPVDVIFLFRTFSSYHLLVAVSPTSRRHHPSLMRAARTLPNTSGVSIERLINHNTPPEEGGVSLGGAVSMYTVLV